MMLLHPSVSLLIFKRNIGFIALKVLAENLLQLSVFERKGYKFNQFPAIHPHLGAAACFFRRQAVLETSPCSCQEE